MMCNDCYNEWVYKMEIPYELKNIIDDIDYICLKCGSINIIKSKTKIRQLKIKKINRHE